MTRLLRRVFARRVFTRRIFTRRIFIRRIFIRRSSGLLLLILTMCAVLTAALPVPGAATPTHAQEPPAALPFAGRGDYPVGTRELYIPDAERPLNATIWYPALNPDALPEETTYTWGAWGVYGSALEDAAPDPRGGPYPLVIFSHGAGSFRTQSIFLTEHLASYGFVVISADHPGSTYRDDRSSGLDLNYVSEIVQSFGHRPGDVLRQLNFAAGLSAAGDFAGVIDANRAAVIGHSFGGYTALAAAGARIQYEQFRAWCREPAQTLFDPDSLRVYSGAQARHLTPLSCFMSAGDGIMAGARGFDAPPPGLWPPTTDARIMAAVALAPWNVPVFGVEGMAALTVPLLVQVGGVDRVAMPQRDAYRAYHYAGSAQKGLVAYAEGGHGLFADYPGDLYWQAGEIHDFINHFTTAFLRSIFMLDGDAAAAFDPGAANADPRVFYTGTLR